MNPKSFRLTNEAEKNLKELAEGYELSESRLVNILLTQKYFQSGENFGDLEAELVLKRYFKELAVHRDEKITQA